MRSLTQPYTKWQPVIKLISRFFFDRVGVLYHCFYFTLLFKKRWPSNNTKILSYSQHGVNSFIVPLFNGRLKEKQWRSLQACTPTMFEMAPLGQKL